MTTIRADYNYFTVTWVKLRCFTAFIEDHCSLKLENIQPAFEYIRNNKKIGYDGRKQTLTCQNAWTMANSDAKYRSKKVNTMPIRQVRSFKTIAYFTPISCLLQSTINYNNMYTGRAEIIYKYGVGSGRVM